MDTKNVYKNRGSEWRRWELHLHTPYTKKEDQYRGDTPEEKWNNFYKSIEDYIGDGSNPLHSICAIAITDYLSIDNYIKVKNDKRLPDSVKYIFPNVELRIAPIASKAPINIHCLFDADIDSELDDRFFAKLKFEYGDSTYGATKAELVRLGKDYTQDSTLNEQDAYITGLNQYVISFKTLSDLFKNDPNLRERTIIVVSNNSKDGASGLRSHCDYLVGNVSQLDATRRAIYQFSDMIYSANSKDISYFLGEGVDNPDTVKSRYGSIMPCIHGCDAHTNEKVFAPDDDRYCWIKADPSFEGLKQVLYEPKERVRIGSVIPDSKPSYCVIDRVEINGNNDFSPEPVYFSDKLTCIIGGKSTGKSLLLHNMAMAIDAEQVAKKAEKAPSNVKQVAEMKVYWRDGACSNDKAKQRKIVYIPQKYLNRLSDEQQETTEIDTIIQDIVLQDESCREAYRLMENKIAEKKQQLAKTIVDFLKIISDRYVLLEQSKDAGDEDAINTEIKELNIKLEELSGEYSVTESEMVKYQNAVESRQEYQGVLVAILKEIKVIEGITSVIESKSLDNIDLPFFKNNIVEIAEKVKKSADVMWLSEREAVLKNAKDKLEEIRISMDENQKVIESLQPKMDGNEQLRTVSVAIVKERERLLRVKEYQAKLLTIQKLYDQYLEILSHSLEDFGNIYNDYVNFVNSTFSSSENDLEFTAKKVFYSGKFSEKIVEILNRKSLSKFKEIDLNNIEEDDICSSNISAFIESIVVNSEKTLQLKNAYSVESALREIFTNWYNVSYTVKMDNDNVQEMSPGKKALVLLRLLISMAESKCPILIDQPEDDLDNRSVFNELVNFIKKKKIDRQIITVTHNANIVLGGDAEMVIIANQNGINAQNRQYRFEYRGGAIEDNSPVLDAGVPVPGILNSKGIQEHICEILEGGEKAFSLRKQKYYFIKR